MDSPLRVLLVDDDEDTRLLMSEALERRGLVVASVESGQACLDQLDAEQFDVVVTDVQMPGMTGIELCRRIAERGPGLLSIVMSGLKDATTIAAALASGAVEFLAKPIGVRALETSIRRAALNHAA